MTWYYRTLIKVELAKTTASILSIECFFLNLHGFLHLIDKSCMCCAFMDAIFCIFYSWFLLKLCVFYKNIFQVLLTRRCCTLLSYNEISFLRKVRSHIKQIYSRKSSYFYQHELSGHFSTFCMLYELLLSRTLLREDFLSPLDEETCLSTQPA